MTEGWTFIWVGGRLWEDEVGGRERWRADEEAERDMAGSCESSVPIYVNGMRVACCQG